MKKTFSVIVAITLIAALVLTGCNRDTAVSTADGVGDSNNGVLTTSASDEYVFILALSNIEYFNAHKYEWNKIGGLMGVKTSVMGPADMDLPATVTAIDQAIAKNPKGICIWGVDPSLDESINKAVAAGIPVVAIIGDQPGSNRTTYIGSYGEDLGYLGGHKLAEALGGNGKVSILTVPGYAQWDEREAGYRKAFAEYPGIEVVAVGDTKADTVTAVQAAKDIMIRFPDLSGFVGCDSTAAIGAAPAVEETGNVGKVKIIGMDRNSDIMEKIRDGIITGTIAQNDASIMYWSLLTLMSAKSEYQPMLTSDNKAAGATTTPSVIYLPPSYVDESNLEYYLEANKIYADAK